jgi:hypothetical protein
MVITFPTAKPDATLISIPLAGRSPLQMTRGYERKGKPSWPEVLGLSMELLGAAPRPVDCRKCPSHKYWRMALAAFWTCASLDYGEFFRARSDFSNFNPVDARSCTLAGEYVGHLREWLPLLTVMPCLRSDNPAQIEAASEREVDVGSIHHDQAPGREGVETLA